jgi:hypothetical protein
MTIRELIVAEFGIEDLWLLIVLNVEVIFMVYLYWIIPIGPVTWYFLVPLLISSVIATFYLAIKQWRYF